MRIRERTRVLARKARAFARPVLDLFPFTPLGLVVLGAAAFALAAIGVRRLDLLLLVVGTVGLALGLFALVFTLVAALVLRFALRHRAAGEALALECGVPARTGMSLPRLGLLPFVTVAWSWVAPEAEVRVVREGSRLVEQIVPRGRVLGEELVRRVVVGDAFGLVRLAFKAREARAIRFLPAKGALERMEVLRSISGGDELYDPLGVPEGERVDTRAYAPGDPARLILWKVYARTRALVVRTPERAFSPARRTVAYVVAGEGDEPAAGAARAAIERGALGPRFLLGADGVRDAAETPAAALEVLCRSASCPEAERGAGLGAFLRRAESGAAATRAVVFVPARPGPWLGRVIAAAGPNAAQRVEIVVCTDGIARDERRSLLARLALRAAPQSGATRTRAADVAAVLGALRAARVKDVRIVDREAGRVYAEAHQRALLDEGAPSAPRAPSSRARTLSRSAQGEGA